MMTTFWRSTENARSPDMSRVVPLGSLAADVSRDFAPVLADIGPPTEVMVVVLDDLIDPAVLRVLPDARDWRDAEVLNEPQLVLLAGGSVVALDASSQDIQSVKVEIASRLQDLVMDARNTSWPVATALRSASVLEPAVMNGVACWTVDEVSVVEFGHLAEVLGS